MTLSLDLILMYLNEYAPVYCENLDTTRQVEGLEFFVPGKEPSPSTILLAEAGEVVQAARGEPERIFFVVNNSNANAGKDEKNIICFSNAVEVAVLLEAYTRLVNELGSWKDRMHRALLEEEDLSRLLEIAWVQIGRPIVSFDSSFNVAACKIGDNTDTRDFEKVVGMGYAPPEFVEQERRRNLGGRIMESGHALIANGLAEPDSYNLFYGHKIGNQFAGMTMIFCGKNKPRPGFVYLSEMFFAVVDLYEKLQEKELRSRRLMYENLLTLLMQTENYPPVRLADQLHNMQFPAEGIFTLVKLDFGSTDYYSAYYLELLRKYFPDLYFFVFQEKLCLLYRRQRGDEPYLHRQTVLLLLEQIRTRLGAAHPVRFRVSNPFEQVAELVYAERQCELLQKLDLQGNDSVLFFEDYLQQAAFSCLENILPEKYRYPSAFVEIRHYDAVRGTSFEETLRSYLKNGGDLLAAAEELHLHRNTVDHRIRKIETLFGLDLKDMKTRVQLYTSFLSS